VVLLSAGYYIPAIICLAFVFYYLRAAVVGGEGVDVSGKDTGKGKADVMAPVSTLPPCFAWLVMNKADHSLVLVYVIGFE
jgi:hypothetical protein